MKFEKLEQAFLTAAQPRMAPHGGGLALVEALATQFEKKGGTIVYNTAAQKLVQDERGGVVGLQAVGPGNVPVNFRGRSVVLGCGGFQGNAEIITRYIGPGALNLRPMSRGSLNNRGEGVNMALDIGAAPCGDFGSWHASPSDPRSVRPGPSIYVYPYGVLVNKRGQRFTDEAPGPTDNTYESVTRQIYAQPDGIAWAILDQRLKDVPGYQGQARTEHPPIVADTLDELARKLGIPDDVFMKTIAEYNAACRPGRYSPLEIDGLATQGIAPRKSNWSLPIDKGPFMAYPIISSIVFTFGGLRVNTNAQVVNMDGDPIPGLYAAGETMGTYYANYTGATSVLKGAVFGRIAGKDAAARARG